MRRERDVLYSRKIVYWKLLIYVVLISLVVVTLIIKNGDTAESPTALLGAPVVFVDPTPKDFRGCDQIVNDDHNIYLLQNNHEGRIDIYDTASQYVKSIMIYKHLNGVFRIAIQEDKLYICDKERNLYLFENGLFVSYFPKYKNEALRTNIDFDANSTTYYHKNGSLWKDSANGPECIIEGTVSTAENIIYWVVRAIGLGALVYLIARLKMRS